MSKPAASRPRSADRGVTSAGIGRPEGRGEGRGNAPVGRPRRGGGWHGGWTGAWNDEWNDDRGSGANGCGGLGTAGGREHRNRIGSIGNMLKEARETPPGEGLGIKEWPASERPREKLLRGGPEALSDAELIALFVRSGTRGRTAVDVARGAIVAAGGLRGLLDLPRGDLYRLPGFGPARYVELQACLEIGRRYLATRLDRGDPLNSTADTARFLMARLRHLPFEVFSCLFLDNRHRVIEFEQLFRGTIDGTSVHAREVVRRALDHNAAAVIFAHNHPSGVAEPSQADRFLTDQLVNALSMVEVTVVDHLIIGDGDCVSFVDLGLL